MDSETTTKYSINLLGKDYLTRQEAAHYACVSLSQFLEHAAMNGIHAFTWMGKVIYRKQDIQRAMEQKWQQSTSSKIVKVSRPITGFSGRKTVSENT